jgi:hypothetical protein
MYTDFSYIRSVLTDKGTRFLLGTPTKRINGPDYLTGGGDTATDLSQ